jgi:peroxiredoxin
MFKKTTMPEPASHPPDIATSRAIAPFELRRLPPFQILKQAFQLYRGSGLELIAVTGAGYILLLIFALFFNLAYQLLAVTQDEVLLTMFLTLGAVSGFIALLGIHIGVTAAVALVITGKVLGLPFSIVNTYRAVLQRWDSLLAALAVLLAIFVVIIVITGIPVFGWFIGPGLLLFWGVLLSLTPAIIMVERMPGPWAVARAWGLARQHIYRAFGVMAVLGVGGALLLAIPSAVMWGLGLPFQVTDIWLPLLLGVFYGPYYAIGATLIYLDSRLRSESFSATELAKNLEEGMPPPSPLRLSTIYAPGEHTGLFTLGELGKFAMMSLVAIVFSIGLGASLFTVANMVEPESPPVAMTADYIGTPAPSFALETFDGEQIALSSLRGKPTVINFWATWCPPCEKELPVLERAYTTHKDGVNFLAISVEETAGIVRPFVEERDLTLPILLDVDGLVVDRYGVKALPTTLFVDADGVIINQHFGELDNSSLAEYLTELTE